VERTGILLAADSGEQSSNEGPDLNLRALFEHVAEFFPMTRAMIGKKSGEIVINSLRHIMVVKIRNWLKNKDNSDKKMASILAESAASAMTGLITVWMEEDMPLPPAEIADKAHRLLMRILTLDNS
jgi:hypothetical protein